MYLTEKARRGVSEAALPQLKTVVEGLRDAALEVAGQNDSQWESMTIEWRKSRTKAIVSNLGRGSLGLTLSAETYSSNGVQANSTFEVSVHKDEPSQAYETWSAGWTHPAPGSSSGHREGDDVVTQLDAEVSRFIDPITTDNVRVSVS